LTTLEDKVTLSEIGLIDEGPVLDLRDYYDPHAGQRPIHDSGAKVKVLEMGRRFGKSRLAFGDGLACFVEALDIEAPRSLIPPWHGWVLSPSFPQSRQVWNEALTLWPTQFIHNVNMDERTIYLKGSEKRPYGILEFKSAHDPESLQTIGLDWIHFQESQDISDRAFEKVLPALTSPSRMGRAVMEGIPAMYATHWFKRVCNAAQQGREGYAYFHATAFDNPLLDDHQKAEIEAHRELLTDRAWRRMYLAEFNEDSGYFSNISPCVVGEILGMPIPGASYVAGLDLGRKVDASVLHIMDAQTRQVVGHQSWDNGTDWVLQREGIVRRCKEWEVQRLIVDATGMGGDIFVSNLIEANMPVEPFIITAASREALLQGLAVDLERQTVQFPNISSLLRQLRSFQYIKLPSGRFRAEAPPGEHDDEVFALALALTACAPSPAIALAPRVIRQARYVPTQAEVNSGGIPSSGALRMKERKLSKIRERQIRAGV
jgi:hypothetical protein